MKIELWAKKIDKGYVKIGTVEVPANIGYEYRLPIRSEVLASPSPDTQTTATTPMSAYRTFRYVPSVIKKSIDDTKRYLED